MAANNISAVQIRNTQDQRRQAADATAAARVTADQNDDGDSEAERVANEEVKKKRKMKQESASIARIKKSKESRRRQVTAAGPDDDNDQDWDMYEKSKPMPGQLDNCENCDKRFTVTPYTKTGSGGGLLCTKCGKDMETRRKKEAKANKPAIARAKRRKVQSDLLDGQVTQGAKSLQELCVKVC